MVFSISNCVEKWKITYGAVGCRALMNPIVSEALLGLPLHASTQVPWSHLSELLPEDFCRLTRQYIASSLEIQGQVCITLGRSFKHLALIVNIRRIL